MPEFLEKKLRREYGDDDHAIFGTMNKIGAMRGNKETAKGREMERKHMADKKKAPFRSTRIEHHDDGSHTVHHEHHMKPTKSPAFHERQEDDTYSAEDGAALMSKLGGKLGIGKGRAESEGAGGECDGGEMD